MSIGTADQAPEPAQVGGELAHQGRTRALRVLASRPTAFWVALVVVAAYVFFGVASNGIFFGAASIDAIGEGAAVGLLLAIGMTCLLAAAQLDISVGYNMVLSSVVAAWVVKGVAGSASGLAASPGRVWLGSLLAVLAGIAAGALFGLVNGLVVTRLKVNSFIATLGTGGIAAGAVLIITNGVNVIGLPLSLQSSFGNLSIAGILPLPAAVALVVCLMLWFIMRRTRFGLHVVAIGTSAEAARRAGLNVPRITLKLFMLAGGLAGLAGFLTIARFSTTDLADGATEPLAAIAAAVIGGTSLFGGNASVGGAIVGALLPVVLASGLVVLNVSTYYQQVAIGVILVLAVYIDQRRRLSRE